MWSRLIIDGNAVYEIDEECEKRRQGNPPQKNRPGQDRFTRRGQVREAGEQ